MLPKKEAVISFIGSCVDGNLLFCIELDAVYLFNLNVTKSYNLIVIYNTKPIHNKF